MEFRSKPDSRESEPSPGTLPNRILSLVETSCGLCGANDFVAEAAGADFEYGTAANEFRFVRCVDCDHLYLNPRPSSDDLGVIYPEDYYAYADEGGGLVSRLRRRWEGTKVALYSELIGTGPRRILDVGCGNGRFLSLLREFGDAEWSLVERVLVSATARSVRPKDDGQYERRTLEVGVKPRNLIPD